MTLEAVLQAFLTLFVIANLLPTLPTVLDQTSHLNRSKARGLRFEALAIANLLVLLFAIGGPSVFEFVGVSIDDLRVAGGAILLTFATYDLLFSRAARTKRAAESDEEDDGDPESGIVPLGIPIMVGPATLVTALIVFQSYGEIVGTIAWTLNLLINMVLLFAGEAIVRVIGPAYSKAFAKIMSLLLATIAVAMIRVGIQGMLAAS